MDWLRHCFDSLLKLRPTVALVRAGYAFISNGYRGDIPQIRRVAHGDLSTVSTRPGLGFITKYGV